MQQRKGGPMERAGLNVLLKLCDRNVILAFQNLPFFISKVGEGNDTTYFSSLLW